MSFRAIQRCSGYMKHYITTYLLQNADLKSQVDSRVTGYFLQYCSYSCIRGKVGKYLVLVRTTEKKKKETTQVCDGGWLEKDA